MSSLPPPPPFAPPPGPPPSGAPSPGRGGRTWWVVAAVALALVAVVAVVVAVLVTRDDGDDRDDRDDRAGRSSSAEPDETDGTDPAEGTDADRDALEALDDERAEAMEAAEELLPLVLGYSYRTIDDDVDTALEQMTEAYAAEQRSTYDDLREQAVDKKATVTVSVQRVGVVGIEEGRAVVLAYLRQQATLGTDEPSTTRSTVHVTLGLDDAGEWKLDDLDGAAAPAQPIEPDPARQEVMDAAETAATAYMSVDHRTVDEDLDRIEELVDGDLAEQFAVIRDDLRSTAVESQTVTEVTLRGSALSSYGGDATAVVLVDATTSTTVAGAPEPVDAHRQLVLGMAFEGGTWRAISLELVE